MLTALANEVFICNLNQTAFGSLFTLLLLPSTEKSQGFSSPSSRLNDLEQISELALLCASEPDCEKNLPFHGALLLSMNTLIQQSLTLDAA